MLDPPPATMGNAESNTAEKKAEVQAWFDAEHAASPGKFAAIQTTARAGPQGTPCGLMLLPEVLVCLAPGAPPAVVDVVVLEGGFSGVFKSCSLKNGGGTLAVESALENVRHTIAFTGDGEEGSAEWTRTAGERAAEWKARLDAFRKQYISDLADEDASARRRATRAKAPQNPMGEMESALTGAADEAWEIDADGTPQPPTAASLAALEVAGGEAKLPSAGNGHERTSSVSSASSTSTVSGHSISGVLVKYKGAGHQSTCFVELVDDLLLYYPGKAARPTSKKGTKHVDLATMEYVVEGVIEHDYNPFAACCGSRYNEKLDGPGGADGTPTKRHGFTIFYQKGEGAQRAKCFLTANEAESQQWVRLIRDAAPCIVDEADGSTVSVAEFMSEARNGDVLLFRGKKLGNKLLRGVTSARFDHVGLVVRGPAGAYLFDATGDGICLHTMAKFVRKRWYRPYQYVCWRRLTFQNKADGKTLPEMPEVFQDALHKFVEDSVGLSYRLSVSALRRKKPAPHREEEGYFCSELVAAAYAAMGLLPATPVPSQYWPVDFQTTGRHKVKLKARMKDHQEQVEGPASAYQAYLASSTRRILWPGHTAPTKSKANRSCLG